MSELLSHLLPSLSYVTDDHLEGILTHWPHTDAAEARQWWPMLLKSHSAKAVTILHERFDPAFWITPVVQTLPFAQVLSHASKALRKSGWDGRGASELALAVAQVTPASTWDDPTVMARQHAWLQLALPHPQSESDDHMAALVELILSQGRFDLNAPLGGAYLGSLLRQPAALRTWLAAGGDLEQRGWDPQQPDLPGWEVLALQQPALREVLGEHVPEVKRRTHDLNRQDAYWGRLLAEKGTADERWDRLVSEPDWDTFRSPKHQMHPLWCAVQRTPGILPKLIRAARNDPAWQARLQARDARGAGLWESLARVADSRSLTDEVLRQLSQWVPPEEEASVVLQGLKNEGVDRERRGGLVVRIYRKDKYGGHTIEIAQAVTSYLGQGWLGQPQDQRDLLAFLQASPEHLPQALEAVVEHGVAEFLIPELRGVLLEQALKEALTTLDKSSMRNKYEVAYPAAVRSLGLGEFIVTPSLVAAVVPYRKAFEAKVKNSYHRVDDPDTLALQDKFRSVERQATLAERPITTPARPRRRA